MCPAVMVYSPAWRFRKGLLPMQRVAAGNRYGQTQHLDSDREEDSADDEDEDEDDPLENDPYCQEAYTCHPSIGRSGALTHTICYRLYIALSDQVFSKTSDEPPSRGPLWDSEGRPCVQAAAVHGDVINLRVHTRTLGLSRAQGRVSGITYGTEEQSHQDFDFVPENIWMLARPDRFPAVPVWKAQPNPTALRRQSGLVRLPVEMLELLLQTIADGPDHPISKGKTLLALAGSSPWLRYHVRISNLWVQICAEAEFLPYTDKTASAIAVAKAIKLSKAQPLPQPKYDWMAYFIQAAKYPSLRNRSRIIRICEEIWDRLGFYRKRI
ncbi:hypothetical protein DFS34DRAFT_434801 [Phlyctochytrium arcticum]|nr:hypothetical protein DFS34DRAFT_598360 [Phlyctochytrium arcticum]KAI9101872.1 hypothetical protein DFS34DRAFT_434801 [Phlyctochytrium arcticum]